MVGWTGGRWIGELPEGEQARQQAFALVQKRNEEGLNQCGGIETEIERYLGGEIRC